MKNLFTGLSDADLHFTKNLILCSGNLKKLASIYEVSYPTIKMRLNRVIAKIEIMEDTQDEFIRDLRSLAVDRDISSEVIDQIIDIYQRKKVQ